MRKSMTSWIFWPTIVLSCTAILVLSACSGRKNEPIESTTAPAESETHQTIITEIDEEKYNRALDLCEESRFFEAFEIFSDLAGFRDAAELGEKAWQSMLLAPVMIDTKWGYIDSYDNLVLPPVYDAAKPFFDGQALVYDENSWNLIDAKGNTIRKLDENWIEVGPFTCGLATFSQEDQFGQTFYGSIDYHGNVIFGAYSDIPIYFVDNTAMIILEYERYYLDIGGNIYSNLGHGHYIPSGFENTLVPTDTLLLDSFCVGTYTSSGPMIDKDLLYEDVKRSYDGNGYHYVDGSIAIPLKFRSCGEFNHGLAPVQDFSGLYGYIDRLGNYVIDPVYEYAGEFSQGMAAVKNDGLYGYINSSGEIVIEPQFFDARNFQEGLASVQVTPFPENEEGWGSYAGWGFIDETGALAIEPQFGYIGLDGFLDGYCVAAVPISEGIYNEDSTFDTEIMKYGFIDTSGNWKVQPRYGYIASHWPGGYLADRNYHFLRDQLDGHIQYDFWTNNKEYIVTHYSQNGRQDSRYYGPDGYVDELTPYSQEVLSERSERPVQIWENLFIDLVSGNLNLTALPRESGKTYYDTAVYYDEYQGLYGFSSKNGSIDVPAKYQSMEHFGNCNSTIQQGWVHDPVKKAMDDGLIDASILDQPYIYDPMSANRSLSQEVFVVNMMLDGHERFVLAMISNMQPQYEQYWGEQWREYLSPENYLFYVFDYLTWQDLVFANGEYDQPQEWEIKPSDRLASEFANQSIVSIKSFVSFYEEMAGKTFDEQAIYNKQQLWQVFSQLVPEEKTLNIFNKIEIDDSIYVARCVSPIDHRLVYQYLQYDVEQRTWTDIFSRTDLAHGIDKIILDDRMEPILFSEYYPMAKYPELMSHGELIAFYEASFPEYQKKWLK